MNASRSLCLLISAVALALHARAADVDVTVSEVREVGGVRYSYRVVNHTDRSIVALRIGFDYLHGVPQIEKEPLGWTPENGLPAASATSPLGWTVNVISMEENPFINIQWDADGGSQYDVRPGTNVGGFTIRLDNVSAEYRNASFDVILSDSMHAYGHVQEEQGNRRRAVRNGETPP